MYLGENKYCFNAVNNLCVASRDPPSIKGIENYTHKDTTLRKHVDK